MLQFRPSEEVPKAMDCTEVRTDGEATELIVARVRTSLPLVFLS